MSEVVPTGWKLEPLGRLAHVVSGGTPSRFVPEFWEGGNIPWVTPTDITGSSGRYLSETSEHITELGLRSCSAKRLPSGTLLMTSRATLGEVRIALDEVCTNQGFKSLIPFKGVSGQFLYYQIGLNKARYKRFGIGTTFLEVNKRDTERFELLVAPAKEQQRIAEILSAIDETIEETDTLIGKYQQIKVGLMQDLFTRGVDSDGKLRPPRAEVPDLHKESPVGWIPKDWTVYPLSSVADTLIDGPFGSNLKTEHYIIEGGVRVVRLQNIHEGIYNDADRAFVSERHAKYLARHVVHSDDVLIAALGEDSYPVGRACCYPEDLQPAINKADCFRLRCRSELAINAYVMHFLNTASARKQVRRFEQGVTRRRINLGNMRRILVPLPRIDKLENEQKLVVERLAAAANEINSLNINAAKLRYEKQGLMADLLTGRVRQSLGLCNAGD